MRLPVITSLLVTLFTTSGCGSSSASTYESTDMPKEILAQTPHEIATFGAGCFWCVEAVFESIDGVFRVDSGYTGGSLENPTYRQISTGQTGHAEVVRIAYDPEQVSYETLLDWLWKSHNPTTLNRQGADVGTQYRSAIFYHNAEQKTLAEASKAAAQADFDSPIVTEISEAGVFYMAEDYHQDYFRKNPDAGYCQFVIQPKLEKLGLE